MANHASHAALPYPIKNTRYTVYVPFVDADGDPTAQTTPDTKISEDNAAATDAAEEVSATSGMDGMGMITFTGAETDCSLLAANFKVASGPKATLMTLYPRVLAEVGTGTLSAGSAGGGTLGTLLAYDVTGCFIKTTGGTGGGGTGGANNQVRKIVTYSTGTGAFTVVPNWETTPSTDTTYAVLLPEGVTLGMLKALNPSTAGRTLQVESDGMAYADAREWLGGTIATPTITGVPEVDVTHWIGTAAATPTVAGVPEVDATHWRGTAIPAEHTAGYPVVTVKDGTGTGEINTNAGAIALVDLVTTTTTATNVTTVNGLAANVITAASFAAGAIDAAAIAANAIGASELAADAVAEIADAVWDEATSGHVASGTFGQALFPIRAATAQAGANGSITLDASASAVDDFYKNSLIVVTGGTGANQVRTISGYTGSTKVATVTPNWGTNPSSDSVFVILPNGAIAGASAPTAGEVADAVWDEARSGHVSAGTFGEYVLADAIAISGDATAANNAESFFDGTGYAGTNNVIPTVTTLTNLPAITANWLTAAGTAADFGTEIGTAVWATTTRTLTALDEDTTTLDLDATIRAAVGMASANLDTQIDGIPTDVRTELTTELARIDVATSTRMATYTQPTGFLAATFPTTVASTTNITAGTITTVTNLTNAPTAGDLTATMKTSVNTEVLDVLNTDTFAEPGQGTPAATATLAAKINYLYKAWRNKKTQTSTTLNLFADDTTTVDQKAVVSDDGTTTTVGEIATGP